MDFKQYGTQAITTLTDDHEFGSLSPALLDQVLGLVGESGEVAEKMKKIIRDKRGELDQADKQELLKEIGDVLWYVNSLSVLLGSDIETVARNNLEKVLSRKDRGVTKGSGDNR